MMRLDVVPDIRSSIACSSDGAVASGGIIMWNE